MVTWMFTQVSFCAEFSALEENALNAWSPTKQALEEIPFVRVRLHGNLNSQFRGTPAQNFFIKERD